MKITSKFTAYQQKKHFVRAVRGSFLIKHLGLLRVILRDVKMKLKYKNMYKYFYYGMYSCVLLTIFGKIQNLKRAVQLVNSLYVQVYLYFFLFCKSSFYYANLALVILEVCN